MENPELPGFDLIVYLSYGFDFLKSLPSYHSVIFTLGEERLLWNPETPKVFVIHSVVDQILVGLGFYEL